MVNCARQCRGRKAGLDVTGSDPFTGSDGDAACDGLDSIDAANRLREHDLKLIRPPRGATVVSRFSVVVGMPGGKNCSKIS